MRRLRGLLLFLLGLIGAAQSVPADEIDDILAPAELAAVEIYRKQGGKSWGEIFGSYFTKRPFDKSLALVIGVNRYDSGWSQLDATRGDPARMRQLLVDQEGFDLVVTLENERATKERIDILMRDVFPGLLGSEDRFLFYFSGHGTQREIKGVGLTGYLPLSKSGRVYGRMISMAELREWDRRIAPVKQVLFLLDSCFSGIAGLQPMDGGERNLGVELLADYGHHLVTAGTADEQTIAGSAWGGSIFTDSLVRGAAGSADSGSEMPKDGVVSLFELKDYVRKRVAAEALGEGWKKPIRPQLYSLSGDNRGEFFFVTREKKVGNRPVTDQSGRGRSPGRRATRSRRAGGGGRWADEHPGRAEHALRPRRHAGSRCAGLRRRQGQRPALVSPRARWPAPWLCVRRAAYVRRQDVGGACRAPARAGSRHDGRSRLPGQAFSQIRRHLP
jgi:hypothetical protein